MITQFTVSLENLAKITNGSALSKMRNFPGATWVVLEPEEGDDPNCHILVPLTENGTERVLNAKTGVIVSHVAFDDLIAKNFFVETK